MRKTITQKYPDLGPEPHPAALDIFKRIATTHSAEEVDGIMIDMNSAHAALTIYENLTEKHRQDFIKRSPPAMAALAWKILGKVANS